MHVILILSTFLIVIFCLLVAIAYTYYGTAYKIKRYLKKNPHIWVDLSELIVALNLRIDLYSVKAILQDLVNNNVLRYKEDQNRGYWRFKL